MKNIIEKLEEELNPVVSKTVHFTEGIILTREEGAQILTHLKANPVDLRVIRLKRKLADRIEEYESETFGRCKNCKKEVVRVNGSDCTRNSDKTRYREPENFTAWNIFRCSECGCVISDNFEAV